MLNEHHEQIATELLLSPRQVKAATMLLDDGSTVPFIARYRKERTGSLDEVAIASIRDRLAQLRALDERRAVILASLSERDLLTTELQAAIQAAASMTELEDLYLPYRPKRRTRAMIARERGLEPLAESLFTQDPQADPEALAQRFIDPENGVDDIESALAGARDIVAETVNESADARAEIRKLFDTQGIVRTRVV